MAEHTMSDLLDLESTGLNGAETYIDLAECMDYVQGFNPYETYTIIDRGTYLGHIPAAPYTAPAGTTIEGTLNIPFPDGKEVKMGWNLGTSSASFLAQCYQNDEPFIASNNHNVGGSVYLSYPLTAQMFWMDAGWDITFGTFYKKSANEQPYDINTGIMIIPSDARQGQSYPDLTFDSASKFFYPPILKVIPLASSMYMDDTSDTIDAAYEFFTGITATDTPYDEGDDSGSYPGSGVWPYDINSPMDFPGFPSLSAINTGFTTLYKPTSQQLREIATWLWSSNFYDNILKNHADPFNNILGLFISPVQPVSSSKTFVVGNVDSNISVDSVANQYVKRNCGSVRIDKRYDSFADTDNWREFKLFLPYYGLCDISSDDFMGGTLEVEYNVDMLTGNAVASVKSKRGKTPHILHQYNCNLFTAIPVSGVNMMSYYSGVMSGAMNVAAGIAAKNPIAVAGGVLNMVNSKPTYGGTNGMSGNAGALGIQYPYLIECRSIRDMPDTYAKDNGIPLNKSRHLSEVTGFTTVNYCRLHIRSASSEEVEEIKRLLKEGVIL